MNDFRDTIVDALIKPNISKDTISASILAYGFSASMNTLLQSRDNHGLSLLAVWEPYFKLMYNKPVVGEVI